MAYTRAWDETAPAGTVLANTLDTVVQNFKTDIRERVAGIFGLTLGEFAADPIVPKTLTLTGALVALTGAFAGGITGNIAGNVTGNVTGNLTGTVLTAAQPNITSHGILTGLTVASGVGANLTSLIGNGGANSDLYLQPGAAAGRVVIRNNASAEIVTISNAGAIVSVAGITGTTLTGTLQTAAQPNITSLGSLNALNLNPTASITADTYISNTGNPLLFRIGGLGSIWQMTAAGHLQPVPDITFNLGAPTFRILQVYASVFNGNLAGNSTTATTLQNARNINGVAFNGSADITIPAAASTLTGNTLAVGVIASSLQTFGVITSLVISGGANITKLFTVNLTWDPPNVAANTFTQTTVAVAGCAVGDAVLVCPKNGTGTTQSFVFDGYVSAAGTVTVTAHNVTAGPIDLPSDDYRIIVMRIA